MSTRQDWRSMAHVTWECKYHVVIVPKYRKKVFFGKRRREIGEILRQLCRQKGVELIEGKAASDHVHMLLGQKRCQGRKGGAEKVSGTVS